MDLVDALQQNLGHLRAALDSGAHRVGWKIGFNNPQLQAKVGLESSVIGHLTSATLVGADGAHSLAGAKNPLLEPEIVIEVGPDRTVGGLGAALELVDMPTPPASLNEVAHAVSTNIFHRAVAIGPSHPGASAEGVTARLTVNGEEHGSADAGAVDIGGTIHLVDRLLGEAGESLQAGDRIIAGTLTPPAQVKPGDSATLDLGPLGSLDINFTH
jgi:2-keto-4-pentenoate hydratase